jgi:hypothetical protein
METNCLVHSPALRGLPELQEMVHYRLRVALHGLDGIERTQVLVTADANYLLMVNGIHAGQGPHRNFPDTLMAEAYDIRPLLKEGINEITALVRHLYTDTFGYLTGEPAFGFAGQCGPVDLSTANGSWECRTDTRWNGMAPRVNMHLGPLEEQWWSGDATGSDATGSDATGRAETGGAETEWTYPVPCLSRERRVQLCPVAPVERTVVNMTEGAAAIGTFTRLPQRRGMLYAYAGGFRVKDKAVAVRVRSDEVQETEQVHIGIRGLGACRMHDDGVKELCHPYGHHVGEGYLICQGSELRQGILLFLFDVEHLVVGAASNGSLKAEVEVVGYAPVENSVLRLYQAVESLSAETPLQQGDGKPALEAIKEVRLHTWKEMDNIVLVKNPEYFRGDEGISLGQTGVIIRLDRFRFGHYRIELQSGPAGGSLDIAYGYTTDEAGKPCPYNWDRLDWRETTAVFDNLFTPRGAQFLFLSSTVPVRITRISVTEALAPAAAQMGSAQSDSEGWNTIWRTALETLRYSRTDVVSSDSFREFCAWLGDTQHISLNYYYTYWDPAFIRYTWELFARNTDEQGRMFSVAPGYVKFQLPVWTWHFWLGVWSHYLYTGDEGFLRRMWPICLSTRHYFSRFETEEGLLRNPDGWTIVDWARIDFAGESFVLNGLYRRALLALSRIADAAGEQDWAGRFRDGADRISQALAHSRFYDGEKRLFRDGWNGEEPVQTLSQHAQILAYGMGLWREEEQGPLWERISDPDQEMWTLGETSFHWALDVLHGSAAFEPFIRYLREIYDWKTSLGAACFGHIHPKNKYGDFRYKQNSPAHAWACAPVYLTGAYLLGVRPAAPGYQSVVIGPCTALADVAELKGEIPTPSGPVEVHWRLPSTHGSGRITGRLPPGMEGVLDLRCSAFRELLPAADEVMTGLQKVEPGLYAIVADEFGIQFGGREAAIRGERDEH